MRHGLRKLATWLVLVVYALSAVSPTVQLVLCVEPEGTVALEAAEPSGCTPCGGDRSSPEAESFERDCCPCSDFPLPWQDERAQTKPKAPDSQTWCAAVVPPICIGSFTGIGAAELPVFVHAQPRTAQRLALIRTVVLRV